MAIKPEQVRQSGCYRKGESGKKCCVWEVKDIGEDNRQPRASKAKQMRCVYWLALSAGNTKPCRWMNSFKMRVMKSGMSIQPDIKLNSL